MAMPSALRNLRKYILAAQRELAALRVFDPSFRMDLDGVEASLLNAWTWTEEYTWTEQQAGTFEVQSGADSLPAVEAGDVPSQQAAAGE